MSTFLKEKYGALAAFICASCFVIGLTFIIVLVPDFNEGPEQRLNLLSKYSGFMQLWYFIIYIVFGASMLVLSLFLLRNKISESTTLQKVATLISFLWTSYIFASGLIAILSIELMFGTWFEVAGSVSSIWRDIYEVQMGLGEGVEWVGGIWMLLISLSLLQQKMFSKVLHYFGLLTAGFGCLTIFPAMSLMGAVFGVMQVIWFIWVGLLVCFDHQHTQNQEPDYLS